MPRGLLAQYDEDGDGQLSEAETQALMDDHRPEGPPPGGMMGMQPPRRIFRRYSVMPMRMKMAA